MDDWMTINEAIETLEISRATLYRWSKAGKLVIYKKLGKSKVKRQDVENLINEEATPLHPSK